MRKLLVTVVVFGGAVLATPTRASADDVRYGGLKPGDWRTLTDVAQFAVSAAAWDVKGAVFKFFDIVVGRMADEQAELDAREMADLKTAVRVLQQKCECVPELGDQMAKLRVTVTNLEAGKASKGELAKAIEQTRTDFGKQLNAIAAKADKTQAELAVVTGRMAAVERDVGDLRRASSQLGTQVRVHDQRLSEHDQILLEHERRLDALEKAAGVFGTDAMRQYRDGAFEQAVKSFEKGAAKDPGDPGYYYGRALALWQLGRTADAAAAIETGVSAERIRGRPGQWYRTAMEKVQGKDRQWFEDTWQRLYREGR